ncbi:MAG TPA: FAD-dependent monooxygenase [Streptosporangiaceae bacterium]|nr:FAD-dependent monooxygenase [Streptosporangiaceae bacterium]
MTGLDAPVGIVGAGPIGLTAALRLASHGVQCVVLDADPDLVKQGSKACLIQGDALEILDKVGCAKTIAHEGVRWHIGHTYVRGKEIRRSEYPIPIGYGPFVNISQYRIEQVLLDHAVAEPLIDIRWSHRVTGLAQDTGEVTVTAQTPSGNRQLRFGYLVACDGVRSTLRELVGVEWTGYSHKDLFLITDVKAKLPFTKERHFHYDPPFNPGRQLVIHPQPDDIWRIDWQLAPGADIEAERRDGRLDRRIRDVIGAVPYEIDWLSTYRFHQRVVDRLLVGRVLLAGDAAHALPPYGSRGMNSGIQDADNLAWKLALVLSGVAMPELLDTYHLERHAAAEENLRITEATIRFMVPPGPVRRWLRNFVLSVAVPVKGARRHVNSGRMAEPHVYENSPIVQSREHNPVLGSFAPDSMVRSGASLIRLRTLFGSGFVALRFAPDPAAATVFHAMAATVPTSVPARFLSIVPAASSDEPAVLCDVDGSVRAAFHAQNGDWFLIRPDGHVAYTGNGDAAEIADAVTRAVRAVGKPARQGVTR